MLKAEVERRILEAALAEFAAAGFDAARVGDIARRAGVSVGNIYHYFPGKKALFDAVVPRKLARRLRKLLEERVRAGGRQDTARPAEGSAWGASAEATVSFALEHRHATLILLGRAQGTPYAGLAEDVVAMLTAAAVSLAERTGRHVAEPLRFDIEQIYRSYVAAWVRLLERFDDPASFREALAGYERYHLEGLRALVS